MGASREQAQLPSLEGTTLSEDISTTENTTTIVETVKTIDELLTAPTKTVEELTQEISVLKQKLHDETNRLVQAGQRFSNAQDDWNTLNEHIKDYADEQNLCAQFENKLAEWNGDYKVFQLEGRIKNYDVSVRIEATYYTTVTVEACSAEAAQEKVEEMDSDEIDNNSGLDWKYPDDTEFNVTDVDES